MTESERARGRMVATHLARRGITDPRVLDAFRSVPREAFVPEELSEFAYDDSPLPIGEGQTISQPYIVAVTIEALRLRDDARVLEIGAGSGYAAAILSRVAKEVYTMERIPSLAATARERLARLGYANVHVLSGDGSLGAPEHAPFDAIAVAAGGPKAPPALLGQLAIGGRLVIPVGASGRSQKLLCITRETETTFREEQLADVRFVPLIGEQAWGDASAARIVSAPREREISSAATLVRETAEPIDSIEGASLERILDRIADARVVLLGESTHGTSEFYRMRARITKELVMKRGFQFVAVEADWPDAARIDDYVLGGKPRSKLEFTPFARFPTWMWRNQEVVDFVEWLRAFNAERSSARIGFHGLDLYSMFTSIGVEWLRAFNAERSSARIGFHGLDLYSMFTSIGAVLSYLDEIDPAAARVARHRYGVLTPWQKDPSAYGQAVLVGRYQSAEPEVVAMLRAMLERRIDYARRDGDRFFDAAQNARLVADAEQYYRAAYYGSAESWNLRDTHMFDTLRSLLAFYGPNAKGVVWEHNSHIGDATATEMSVRGEHNVGQLCRAELGRGAYIVGFGTDRGTVAAASNWDEPMERMRVRPAVAESYERIFHDSAIRAFALHLREPSRRALREELAVSRLERAIGVVYRPESELASHYFYASLASQFDEYIWMDETSAVQPLEEVEAPRILELPDTYPFGV